MNTAAFFLAAFAWGWQAGGDGAEAEAQAVKKLEAVGGRIVRDKKAAGQPVIEVHLDSSREAADQHLRLLAAFPEIRIVRLAGLPKVTGAGLRELGKLKNLQRLMLSELEMDDEALKALKLSELPSLEHVFLSKVAITDESARALAGIKKLKGLYLPYVDLTDAGLKTLAVHRDLEALNLSFTRVTDAGMKSLSSFTKLQALSLPYTDIGDEGLRALPDLEELKQLYVGNTKVTDRGVKHLLRYKNLEALSLWDTAVTDVGAKELAALTKLRVLYLDFTNVSQAMVAQLEKTLPRCEISVSPREAEAPLPGGYSFKLNGERIRPAIFSLRGTPDEPQEGDLIRVERLLITLGPEKEYDFIRTPREDGRLLLRGKDGKKRAIAATVDWTYENERIVHFNPLEKMTPEEIRNLRGIHLNDWPEKVEQALKQLDPAKACITIGSYTAQGDGKTMPPLPDKLQYLEIAENTNRGIKDYSAIATQSSLKFLSIDSMRGRLDGDWLKKATGLRYLNVSGVGLENAEALAALTELRVLGLGSVHDFQSIEFLKALPALVELNLRDTAVRDLTPLAGHKSLASVQANRSALKKLPGELVPRLRRLEVMSTALTDEAVAGFAKMNPQCEVLFRWEKALLETLKGATRLRVRSGGTCHRRPEQERMLFEVKDAAKLAKLIANVRIDEGQSGSHCLCCGDPSLEFFKGDTLVVTLGFHHGQAMRWPGVWPGDGALTDASADFLCAWLAENGYSGAFKEREGEKKRAEAARRQSMRYEAILPADVARALKTASSREEAVAAVRDGIKDEEKRALVCLRLYGCDNRSWSTKSGLDDLLAEALLPGLSKDALAAALGQTDSPEALTGAARWLFYDGAWEKLDEESLAAVVPAIAKYSVAHPQLLNRRQTMAVLGKISGKDTTQLLRSVLAGEVKQRPLPKDEEVAPGGLFVARPGDSELEKGSDRAFAGYLLAQRGDLESLPAIEKLAENATGDDVGILKKAMEILKKKK